MKQTVRTLLAGIGLAVLSSGALAQQGADLTGQDYISALQSLANTNGAPMAKSRRFLFQPLRSAGTVGIPSGFALPGGTGFVAGSLSNSQERRVAGDADASAALGFGLGDAARGIGLETVIALSSVRPDKFASSGSWNFKLSRQVPSPFAQGIATVAVGATGVAPWGDATVQDPGYYAIGSSSFLIPNGGSGLPGMVSIGYGTNIGTLEDTDGLLFGLGFGLGDWASAGVSWFGNELMVGANTGVRLTPDTSLQIGVSFSDVTKRNSEGRWVLNMALVSANLFK